MPSSTESPPASLATGDAGQAPSAGQAQAAARRARRRSRAPDRGAVWEAHKAMLPRRWFLQLTAEPLAAATAPTTFRHQVSGSLTVLALYRVVAVSAASVESDFRSSPILPRGVPNVLAPPTPVDPGPAGHRRPRASCRRASPSPCRSGPTPAARCRLRRASATTDPALMPVVAEGTVRPRAGGARPTQSLRRSSTPGPRRAGAGPRCRAWVRYTWRVEVQGADLPGGGPSASGRALGTGVDRHDAARPPAPVTGPGDDAGRRPACTCSSRTPGR